MSPRRLIPAAMLVALVGLAPTTALAQPDRDPDRSAMSRPTPRLNTTGFAEVRRAPDQAEVSLGVAGTGKTSAEATDTVNKSIAKVVAAIKALNQPGLVVQTQTVTLMPQYRQERDFQQTQAPEIIGYTAQSTVRIVTSDVARIGQAIDAGLKSGANQVFGITFSLKDDAEAKRVAMQQAAQDARTKADTLASSLGVTLGPVLEANTDGSQVRPFMSRGGPEFAPMMAGKADFAPTTIEAGEVVVTATVSVSYLIEQAKAR